MTRKTLLIFVVLAVLFNLLWLENIPSINPASRLATVEALVEHSTYSIDHTRVQKWTLDKVKVNGKLQSSKPPLLSTLGAGPYWLWSSLTGQTFHNNVYWTTRFMTWTLGSLAFYLLLWLLYKNSTLWIVHHRVRYLTLGFFALGSLNWGFARTITNHNWAAVCVLAILYFWTKIEASPSERSHWIGLGIAAGFLPTLDIPYAIVSTIVFGVLTFRYPQFLYRWSVPVALAPLSLHFYLTWNATGSFLPVYLREKFYQYQGSHFSDPKKEAETGGMLVKFFKITIGQNGYLIHTPLLVLGLWSLIQRAKLKIRLPSDGKGLIAATFLVSWIALFVTLWLRAKGYGGANVGYRWMMAMSPVLFLFAGVFVDQRTSWVQHGGRQKLLWIIFAMGTIHSVTAMVYPWRDSLWAKLLNIAGLL